MVSRRQTKKEETRMKIKTVPIFLQMKSKNWIFIDTGKKSPHFNMEFDRYFFENFGKTFSVPIFRLYEWEFPAITVGKFQKPEEFLNMDEVKKDSVSVIKRITGGGAILHDFEVTFSFVTAVPEGLSVREGFRFFNRFLILAYRKMGLDVNYSGKRIKKYTHTGLCFSGREEFDINFRGKKIGGTAQRRRGKVLFQHGVVPLKIDFSKIKKYFKKPEVNAVSLECLGIKKSVAEVKEILKKSFAENLGVNFDPSSPLQKDWRPEGPPPIKIVGVVNPDFSNEKSELIMKKFPYWLDKKISLEEIISLKKFLTEKGIHTVCEEARCPNISECFSKKQATFLILGKICTRGCLFCGIQKGKPEEIETDEAEKILDVIKILGLKHIVITSPTRDDIYDGGAGVFAEVVRKIRKTFKNVFVEILIPDFSAKEEALKKIAQSKPDIVGHNLETIPRLYKIRKGADYRRSLFVLEKLSEMKLKTKSAIMLGLGEKKKEVLEVFRDLLNVNCKILRIGQYLPPTKKHYPVKEFVHPEKFKMYGEIAKKMGFEEVLSAPYVRSSLRIS